MQASVARCVGSAHRCAILVRAATDSSAEHWSLDLRRPTMWWGLDLQERKELRPASFERIHLRGLRTAAIGSGPRAPRRPHRFGDPPRRLF